jgi:hypothetical protein
VRVLHLAGIHRTSGKLAIVEIRVKLEQNRLTRKLCNHIVTFNYVTILLRSVTIYGIEVCTILAITFFAFSSLKLTV